MFVFSYALSLLHLVSNSLFSVHQPYSIQNSTCFLFQLVQSLHFAFKIYIYIYLYIYIFPHIKNWQYGSSICSTQNLGIIILCSGWFFVPPISMKTYQNLMTAVLSHPLSISDYLAPILPHVSTAHPASSLYQQIAREIQSLPEDLRHSICLGFHYLPLWLYVLSLVVPKDFICSSKQLSSN